MFFFLFCFWLNLARYREKHNGEFTFMDENLEPLFCRLEGHFGISLQVNSFTMGRLDMISKIRVEPRGFKT
jgi:hypothetical protein